MGYSNAQDDTVGAFVARWDEGVRGIVNLTGSR